MTKQRPRPPDKTPRTELGICILSGGLSLRMGQDKGRIRLSGRSLLGWARLRASRLGAPVRVIRQDLIARCGPLGGVYTGLTTSRAEAEAFLACDMPFVTVLLLRRLRARYRSTKRPVFVECGGQVGFPFILPHGTLDNVIRQINRRVYSLAKLADELDAIHLDVGARGELENINTPEDLARARER